MNRKVYLIGEIEKRFGSEFSINADTYSDIIKCINCNRPGFIGYLLNCYEEGVGFTVNSAGKNIEAKELFTPLKEGDITIAAIPAGSKSDAGKIVTAIMILIITRGVGASEWYAAATVEGAKYAALAEGAMWLTKAYGVMLAQQGIQGIMAPDPATEAEQEDGYLFSGSQALVVEGDPIPLLYGLLRVPGQTISVAFNSVGSTGSIGWWDGFNVGTGDGLTQDDCFDPDTFIQMADGSEKKIKDIELGDNTKGGEVTGVYQFKTKIDSIHNYKDIIVAGGHFVKENGEFIMVKDSPLSIKIDKIPIVYSLRTTDRRIFINDIEFANYNGDGIAKNFLKNAGADLTGFDKEVLRQVEERLI